MSNKIKMIIDTENYAGNFEREMCAYITGQVGDCGVGEELAISYNKDIQNLYWFNEHVYKKNDPDDGCSRPVNISVTPGWFNNGHGVHIRENNIPAPNKYPAYLSIEINIDEMPTSEIIDEVIARAKRFCTNRDDIYEKANLYLTETAKNKPLTYTGFRIVELAKTSVSIVDIKV